MQNDFTTGVLGNDDCKAVIEPIKKLIESGGWDDIRFTMDDHRDESRYKASVEGKTIPRHCVTETDGWDVVPELKGFMKRAPVTKESFGSFTLGADIQYDVENMIWDRYTNRGEEYEIHLCGVCTSICVLSNAAILRSEFPCAKIVVHQDCTADVTPEKKAAALECMKSILCEVV